MKGRLGGRRKRGGWKEVGGKEGEWNWDLGMVWMGWAPKARVGRGYMEVSKRQELI